MDDGDDDDALTQVPLQTLGNIFATQLPTSETPDVVVSHQVEAAEEAGNTNHTLRILREADLNERGQANVNSRAPHKRPANDDDKTTNTVSKRARLENGETIQASSHDKVRSTTTAPSPVTRHSQVEADDYAQRSRVKNLNSTTDDMRARTIQELRSIWSNDEHYGIPAQWRNPELETRLLKMYLDLCQTTLRQDKSLDGLWKAGAPLVHGCLHDGKLSANALNQAGQERNLGVSRHFEGVGASSPKSLAGYAQKNMTVGHSTRERNHSQLRPSRQISSRLSRVPKDQQKILESASSFYPSLPGTDTRSGSLPQHLHERFCVQAELERGEAQKSSRSGTQAQNAANVSKTNIDETLETDNESAQEVSASQWPPSPELPPPRPAVTALEHLPSRPGSLSPTPDAHQARLQLPPDSSLPSSPVRLGSAAQSQDQTVSDILWNSTIEDKRVQGAKDQQAPTAIKAVDRIDRHAKSSEASSSVASGSEVADWVVVEDDIARVKSSAESGVQVQRTPHPGKLQDSITRSTTSAHRSMAQPASTFVASTYNELQPTRHEAGGEGSHLVVHAPRDDTLSKAAQAPRNDPRNEKHATSNRDAQDDEAIHSEKMTEAREWRRKMLKPISKQAIRRPAAASSEPEARDPVVAKQQKPISMQSHSSTSRITGSSTKSSFTSPMPKANQHKLNDQLRRSSSVTKLSADTNMTELYDRFVRAYPDYNATQRQFEGGCRFLNKQMGVAKVHSSLLDDYVYHYTTTYRSHCDESHDNGEDPMNFNDYFDCVQPNHMSRVISATAGQDRSRARDSVFRSATINTDDGDSRLWLTNGSDAVLAAASNVRENPQEQADKTAAEVGEGQGDEQAPGRSQRSSVEEWIETTIASRPPSPELGTPNVDRSIENSPASQEGSQALYPIKRALHLDHEERSRAKRVRPSIEPKIASSPAVSSFKKPSVPQRASIPASTSSSGRFPGFPDPPPSFSAKKAPVRRSLPWDNRSATERRASNLSASQASTTRKTAVQERTPTGNASAAGSMIPASSAASRQPPSLLSSVASKTEASNARKTRHERDSDWWADQNTPFKRFASRWMQLPTEKVREKANAVDAKRSSTYTLVDVTQFRK